jgi:hypothetical protein
VSVRGRIEVSHGVACLAAALVQLALLALLLSTRKPLAGIEEREPAPITFFPSARLRDLPAQPVQPVPSSDRPKAPRPPDRRHQPPDPPRSSAPITIDWAKEATLSAERQVAAAEEADRRASAFARNGRSSVIELDTAPEPEPRFGWSHARTHRIERTADGATILWLNDRCAIVLSALFPVCTLDKPKANGALFEHMRDPPKLGDWKD